MSRWYGNLSNRLDENKNFTNRGIKVGDDITEYLWSDRKCYFITKVVDQKHIFVKPKKAEWDIKIGYTLKHAKNAMPI